MFTKFVKDFIFLILPGLLFALLLFELVFRFIIPAAEFSYTYYDPKDQILRFDLNGPRTGVYTVGKLAQLRAKWRINNMGWNSNIDYLVSGRDKPLIAIIGDSMIEAFQVNTENSVAAKLREKVQGQFDVYSFGISGAPLSEYLQMSRYVNKYFRPDILVINVVQNDFDESLCSIKRTPGMLCIEEIGSEIKESKIDPYVPSRVKRILGHSSLVRYLYATLKFGQNVWIPLRDELINKQKEYNANVNVESVDLNRDKIVKAIDYILAKFKEENPGKKIIFMIDAPRNDIYSNKVAESNVLWMNKLLGEKCHKYGFYFIDLTGPFSEKFKSNKVRFESKYDWHWNEIGHMTAARVLFNKLKEMNVIRDGIYGDRKQSLLNEGL